MKNHLDLHKQTTIFVEDTKSYELRCSCCGRYLGYADDVERKKISIKCPSCKKWQEVKIVRRL